MERCDGAPLHCALFQHIALPNSTHNSLWPFSAILKYFFCHVLLQIIKLEFLTFDLEYSSNCWKDKVTVYDGEDDSAPRLVGFCGSKKTMPGDIISSNNSLFVSFQSDSLYTDDGFKMKYTTVVSCKCHML